MEGALLLEIGGPLSNVSSLPVWSSLPKNGVCVCACPMLERMRRLTDVIAGMNLARRSEDVLSQRGGILKLRWMPERSPEYLRGIEKMNKNTPVCTIPYLSIRSGPRPNGGDVGDKAHKYVSREEMLGVQSVLGYNV